MDASLELMERARARAQAALAALGDLGVQVEPLAQALAQRALAQQDPQPALDRLFAEDLALALACGQGSRAAMERFEREYGGEVDRAFRRMSRDAPTRRVRQRVLGPSWANARDPDYSGQAAGSGSGWRRCGCSRTWSPRPARDAAGGRCWRPAPATADPGWSTCGGCTAPNLSRLAAAVAALDVDDRVLLHQRFASPASMEELAAAHDVHVNTISRWLQRARAALESSLRDDLQRRLRVSEDQLQSILRLVQSQLDVTLGRLLE
jgi:RNA polymerase sigma-70 factor (ECF subfamily)